MTTKRAGYVVRVDQDLPAKDGSTKTLTTWWYGPDHGWGTTSGGRADSSVRVFPNRLSAERALASVYGSVAAAKRRGYRVVAS